MSSEAVSCYRVVWRALGDGKDDSRLGPSFALYAAHQRDAEPRDEERWAETDRRFIDRTCREELGDLPYAACTDELRFAVNVPWCGGFGAGP